jgi:murein DD-endopeptidase MepM/ murein hydrolase activator NlpD
VSFLTIACAVSLLAAPLARAHASVFSLLSAIFGERAAAETAEEPTGLGADSQLMPLLAAAPGAAGTPVRDESPITIIDGSALLSEIGPTGVAGGSARVASDKISIYVVRPGDSLSEIADMFDVSVNTVVWANDIERDNLIHTGQTLVILPVTGVRHEVRAGETLKSVAARYRGDIDDILLYNNLAPDATLAVGDVVIIPDGEIAQPSPTGAALRQSGRGAPSYEGYYLRPIPGGRRTQGLHGYNGIDLAGPTGTPILAAASGEVLLSKKSGWNGGYGTYIVISHGNGTQTLYAHNSLNIVNSGEQVAQGQIVGYIGATGKATGPHLHFEVRGAKNPF